jgi:hypothetical protein
MATLPPIWTVPNLAALVKSLRIVQKANGIGYSTPAAAAEASPLEAEVDAAIAQIEKHRINRAGNPF